MVTFTLAAKNNKATGLAIANMLNVPDAANATYRMEGESLYINEHRIRITAGALYMTHCGNVQHVPGKRAEIAGRLTAILNSTEYSKWLIREELAELYHRVTTKIAGFAKSKIEIEGERVIITCPKTGAVLRFNLLTGNLSLMRVGDDAYYTMEGGTLSERAMSRDRIRGFIAATGYELP